MIQNLQFKPLVSVVIPCYNHEKYVTEAIQSIIDQDYQNIELIVIDDGSSDQSVDAIREIASECKRRFIRFEFRYRENKGLCLTLNEALAWCRGVYFSPFASDDIALPNKISYLIDKITRGHHAAVFGVISEIYASNSNSVSAPFLMREQHHFFKDLFLQNSLPSAPAALINTQCIRDVGGYPPDVKIEDWYMWLKLTEYGGSLVTYPNVVAFYRQHSGNTTKKHEFMRINRRIVVEKFRHSNFYSEAIKKLNLQEAQEFASSKKIEAIKSLIKAKKINLISVLIIFKILLPNFIIQKLKKYFSY